MIKVLFVCHGNKFLQAGKCLEPQRIFGLTPLRLHHTYTKLFVSIL